MTSLAFMELINFNRNTSKNLLPFDGEVFLYENFLTEKSAFEWYKLLDKNIAWKQEGMKMYGKYLDFPRLTAWYGDDGKLYKYSGLVNHPLPFTKELLEIKQAVEHKTGELFNAALLNLYRSGNDSMGWHSDDEKELGILFLHLYPLVQIESFNSNIKSVRRSVISFCLIIVC